MKSKDNLPKSKEDYKNLANSVFWIDWEDVNRTENYFKEYDIHIRYWRWDDIIKDEKELEPTDKSQIQNEK